jgi:microcystin-dependent protein
MKVKRLTRVRTSWFVVLFLVLGLVVSSSPCFAAGDSLSKEAKEKAKYIPAGCVAAFAMEIPPEGWLECNGQAISRTDYESLFKMIGTTFGEGDGIDTFNVPDLRGIFIRGWAHGSENDPDRDNRTASSSWGASGDQVGSCQEDALQSHKHNFSGTYSKTNVFDLSHRHWVWGAEAKRFEVMHNPLQHIWAAVIKHRPTERIHGGHSHGFTPKGVISTPVSANVSEESRPKNIYLMYCIKY